MATRDGTPRLRSYERIGDDGRCLHGKHDTNATKANGQKKKGSQKSDYNNKSSGGDKFCLLHGHGNHATDECIKLKSEAKRLKTGGSQERSSSSHGNNNNKTWSRKAEAEKTKTKKDLATVIKKQVQKELASVDKKRKSSDDDDQNDLNVADLDLSGFNYEDMDNLKIDSSDEISV